MLVSESFTSAVVTSAAIDAGELATLPSSLSWSGLGSNLRASPLINNFLDDADGVVSDLDFTLVDSTTAFTALDTEIARRIGVTDIEKMFQRIEKESSRMRGLSVEDYTKAFLQICQECGVPASVSVENLQENRRSVLEGINSGSIVIGEKVPQIPDSYVLLASLKEGLSLEIRIATNSPSSLKPWLIDTSGYEDLIPRNCITFEDDTEHKKSESAYWEVVLGDRNPSKILGLDDTPHGAEWMLEVAQLGKVIVRPSQTDYHEALLDLQQRYGESIVIVKEFGDLFSIR